MGSGCGDSIVEKPSSSGQLPVPVALNALSPTLFRVIIHQKEKNVNTFFIISGNFYRKEKPPDLPAAKNKEEK